MTAAEPLPGPQSLLDHAAFVHAVARGLLGPSNAEDVAQDTWLRALRSKRTPATEAKSWLGAIARNRARDVSRGERKRSERERVAAKPEAIESVDTTYARLAAQRDVVTKILALDEPYKSVVILRYYHELSHDEIAAKLGSKPSTVRTQLVRAHEQLRVKLDREYGGRQAWAGLLAPTLVKTTRSTAVASAVAVAIVAVGVGAYWFARPEAQSESVAAAPESRGGETPSAEQGRAIAVPTLDEEPSRTAVATSAAFEPADETLCEPAELFDRERYRDYEKASFSFVGGRRDDPMYELRNDWDVLFSRTAFDVVTVTDDRSLIVDLGERPLESLASGDLSELKRITADAVRRRAADPKGQSLAAATAILGHTYFVWSRDSDSDVAAAFEVMELVENRRCMFDWYATTDGRTAKGSIRDSSTGRSLMRTLAELRRAACSPRALARPRVVLQLRSGANGGNPIALDAAGDASRVNTMRTEPLDLRSTININERQIGYSEGGFVPLGSTFVVTRANYRGVALGDSNGSGELHIELAGQTLFDAAKTNGWIEREWTGRAEIRAGEESRTFLRVSNSSAGELVLDGEFVSTSVPPPEARPQVAAPTPRADRKSAGPRLIESPTPRLQVSATHNHPLLDGRHRLEWLEGRIRMRSDEGEPIAMFDFGEVAVDQLEVPAPGSELEAALRAEASAQFAPRNGERTTRWVQATAVAGHVLLVVIDPFGQEPHSALLRVVESDAARGCVLDTYIVKSAIGATGSLSSATHPRGLDRVLAGLVEVALADFTLAEPHFEFQARPEHDSSVWIHVNGRHEPRSHVQFVDAELDLEAAEIDGPQTVRAPLGRIPADQQLVVTRVEYGSRPRADSQFPSLFGLVIRDQRLVHEEPGHQPLDGVWTGEIVVRPGDERFVALHASYVRSAWARFEGRFEPLDLR